MCDPTTFNSNSLTALQAGGSLMSTVGAYYTAGNQKIALQSQADMADISARLSERAAQSALQEGAVQESKSRYATTQLKSTQHASLAANGLVTNEGTAKDIQTSTEYMGKLDADIIAANAARAAWGYRMQGVNFENDALMKRTAAGSISPGLSGFSTLLTGAGSIAKDRYLVSSVRGNSYA